MGWVVSVLLIVSGLIASLFIKPQALNFQIVQMVIAVLVFSLIMIIIAFWSSLMTVFKQWFGWKKK